MPLPQWSLRPIPPPESVTVFVGQCFVAEDGKEQLNTVWLLRGTAASRKDDWKATR